jgi:hypothetical protein
MYPIKQKILNGADKMKNLEYSFLKTLGKFPVLLKRKSFYLLIRGRIFN